jgi:hypothetical protein
MYIYIYIYMKLYWGVVGGHDWRRHAPISNFAPMLPHTAPIWAPPNAIWVG